MSNSCKVNKNYNTLNHKREVHHKRILFFTKNLILPAKSKISYDKTQLRRFFLFPIEIVYKVNISCYITKIRTCCYIFILKKLYVVYTIKVLSKTSNRMNKQEQIYPLFQISISWKI